MTGARGRGAGRIRLRPGRPGDAPGVARVMRAAVRGLPEGACTPRQRAAWSSLPALYHRWASGPGGERYLLAERAGRVIGYAAYLPAAPARVPRRPGAPARARREAELTAVFVLPAAGGQGIGRALVAAVALRARRSGAAALVVLAARPAIGFYARLGFSPGLPARSPLPGGVRLPARRMRLRLAPLPRRVASPPRARAPTSEEGPARPAPSANHRRRRPG